MRTWTTALFAACLLTACQGSTEHGSFTPYRAMHAEQATDTAVRLENGDRPALAKMRARFVGELEVDSAGDVASEAAKVGATHYLQAGQGRFILFRVDPTRWAQLPEHLRPGMNGGESVSTTMLTSAPLR